MPLGSLSLASDTLTAIVAVNVALDWRATPNATLTALLAPPSPGARLYSRPMVTPAGTQPPVGRWVHVGYVPVDVVLGEAAGDRELVNLFRLNPAAPQIEWPAGVWIVPYFIGMLVISQSGDFGPGGIIGGTGIFKHVLDHGGNNDLGLIDSRQPPGA